MYSSRNKHKVFCIGCGKTGTTSVEKALKDLGYKLGDQASGELLLEHYANRNFKAVINFCKTADAFQDAPFSFQHTFIALDQYFKNAKFVLTVETAMRFGIIHWSVFIQGSIRQKIRFLAGKIWTTQNIDSKVMLPRCAN